MPLHIDLSSYSDSDSIAVAQVLLGRYKSTVIPHYTTDPRQKDLLGHIFVSEEEFKTLYAEGRFGVTSGGGWFEAKQTHYALPRIDFWPEVTSDVELLISFFGEASATAKRVMAPSVVRIFVTTKNKDLLRARLLDEHKKDYLKWRINKDRLDGKIKSEPEKLYDHVVHNDVSFEDCAAQVEELMQRITTTALMV